MSYIITNRNDKTLVWSNTEGWTDGDNYETFSDSERETLNLPIEGQWEAVPWSAQ